MIHTLTRKRRVKRIDFYRKMPVLLLWSDIMESIKPLTIKRKLLSYHQLLIAIHYIFPYIEEGQILKSL